MNGLNRVILVGTLGQDPKLNTSRDGKPYTTLNLATNRSWKNKDGEDQEKTDWHRILVWGRQGAICHEHLKKGQSVCVEGHISTSVEQDADGGRRWHTYITAEDVNFMSRKDPVPH